MKIFMRGVLRDVTDQELEIFRAKQIPEDKYIVRMFADEMFEIMTPELRESIPDESAKYIAIYFPHWDGAGVDYALDDRVYYEGSLYKCITAHTSQETWTPKDAHSLWTNISEEMQDADGSINNPYVWEMGMISYEGKYYTEDDKLYICTRDSIDPLYFKIADLIGHYFNEVVN